MRLLVSVIMAARNAAVTLPETLQSLSAQTFEAWQAIIVDDGSSDATAAVAREWSSRDGRIEVISLPPTGASAARNRGVEAASGHWLVFLDADDLLHGDHLAAMLARAQAVPGARLVHCWGCHIVDGRQGRVIAPPKDRYFQHLSRRNIFFIHGVVLDRQAFIEMGGFDEGLIGCEEWDLWQRMARAGHVFSSLERPLAYYRLRPGSLCSQVPEMLECAHTVIRRGHGPDPRVANPLPDFAAGMPRRQLPGVLFSWWLWAAGNTLGLAGDPLTLLPRVDVPADIQPAAVAQLLLQAMARGACRLDRDVDRLAVRQSPQLKALLDYLENETGQPGFAERCYHQALELVL